MMNSVVEGSRLGLINAHICLYNRGIGDKSSANLGGSNPGGRKRSRSTGAAVATSHLKRRSQRGEHPTQCTPDCTFWRGRKFCCSCISFYSAVASEIPKSGIVSRHIFSTEKCFLITHFMSLKWFKSVTHQLHMCSTF